MLKGLSIDSEQAYILICKSLNHVLKAERVMRVKGIPIELIPTPRGFGSPCTTAIIFHSDYRERLAQLIEEHSIAFEKIEPMKRKKRQGNWSQVYQFPMSEDFEAILKKAEKDEPLEKNEIIRLLEASDKGELDALFKAADLVRKECVGDKIEVRGAIEFSNYCRRNCSYCGIRKENTSLERYRMTTEQILTATRRVAEMGLRTVILQSGEDPWYTTDEMLSLIRQIKDDLGLRITLSLGEREPADYSLFREAGANNYLLKIEAANKALYKKMHPDTQYEERVRHLDALKNAGYFLGSGNIVGLPGQTIENLAEDILFMKEFGIHMIGIGPFIPAGGTPLENHRAGGSLMTIKTVAVTRIVCQNVFIPATTALASVDPEGLKKALTAGANTVMLILTPPQFRDQYVIYNKKKVVGIEEVIQIAKELGRKLPAYLENKYPI